MYARCFVQSIRWCTRRTSLSDCLIFVYCIFAILFQDENNPWAEAIAFDKDGVIVAVGNLADAEAAFPDYAKSDLQGALVLPGFQDVHLHAVVSKRDSPSATLDPKVPANLLIFASLQLFHPIRKLGLTAESAILIPMHPLKISPSISTTVKILVNLEVKAG